MKKSTNTAPLIDADRKKATRDANAATKKKIPTATADPAKAEAKAARDAAKKKKTTPPLLVEPAAVASVGEPDDDWPKMDDAAYHGLAGKIVRTLAPHTESDPVGLLIHTLVFYGNVVGRTPHLKVDGAPHYCNLYAAIAGDTAFARKGTAAGNIKIVFGLAGDEKDEGPKWLRTRVKGALTTYEGLVKQIKDADPKDEDQKPDKRVLFLISELGSLFVAMRRGTLAEMLPVAWDGGDLPNLTKQKPMTSTEPMVSIMGHITDDKLTGLLTNLLASSGWANRFLFLRVRRSGRLPDGGDLSPAALADLGTALKDAIDFGSKVGLVKMTDAAKAYWDSIYDDVTSGPPGALGDMIAREAPQVRRLALIYTLLDKATETDVVHLRAAYAVVKYCRTSVEQLFTDKLADPKIERVVTRLTEAGKGGMRYSDIYMLWKGKIPTNKVRQILAYLVTKGTITTAKKDTAGRSGEWYYIAKA